MRSCLAAVAFLATATLSPAALVNTRFDGVLNSNTIVPLSVAVNGVPQVRSEAAGLLLFTNTVTNIQFLAYCLEPFVSIGAVGGRGTYDDASATWGNLTPTQQNAIRLLLGQVSNPFSPSLSVLPEIDQAALQIGIWEIVGEATGNQFNAGSGNVFVVSNPNTLNVIARANTFLSAVNANQGSAFTGVISLTSATLQDLIVIGDPGAAIPEPRTMMLVGGALVILGLLRHRR